MFERFNQPARQVVVRAQEEARSLRHEKISLEHLFLALIGDETVGPPLLELMGLDESAARQRVAELMGTGTLDSPQNLPFTPSAKRLLENTLRQSLRVGSDHIAPEHMVLALFSPEMASDASLLSSALDISLSVLVPKVTEMLHLKGEEIEQNVSRQIMRAIGKISPGAGLRFRKPPSKDEVRVFELVFRGASVSDVAQSMSKTVDEVMELAASAFAKVGFQQSRSAPAVGHTERVERALSFAREEANETLELMDVEHLLLALTMEKGTVAARALSALGVGEQEVRDVIAQLKELARGDDADEA